MEALLSLVGWEGEEVKFLMPKSSHYTIRFQMKAKKAICIHTLLPEWVYIL